MPSSEFSEAMTIDAISFHPVPGTGTHTNFTEFYIDMGYCAAGELDPVFDSNYVSGTKKRVFEQSGAFTLTATEPWTTISLGTSFFFDPAAGNLVIEILWPDGDDEFYSYDFPTSGVSVITAAYNEGVGNAFSQAPHLLLEGTNSFEQMTFAGIKASFN